MIDIVMRENQSIGPRCLKTDAPSANHMCYNQHEAEALRRRYVPFLSCLLQMFGSKVSDPLTYKYGCRAQGIAAAEENRPMHLPRARMMEVSRLVTAAKFD